MAKLAINTGSNTDVETGLIIETTCFNSAFATEDAKEGLNAFCSEAKVVNGQRIRVSIGEVERSP